MIGLRLYSAEQSRQLDRVAIDEFGVPGYTLMQRAGQACMDELRRRYGAVASLTVVCGAGNNAGDGYVIARLARQAGMRVQCLWLVDPQKLSGDAAKASADFQADGGEASAFDSESALFGEVVVDALLGTGLTRPVDGAFAAAVDAINAAAVPVLSVDLPSGLSADSGSVMGRAVRADLTVTFIGRKRGLYTGDALDHVGELEFADLDTPPAVYDNVACEAWRIDQSLLPSLLQRRPRNVHKGSHGSVLIIGGDRSMGGAARLAGEAALRSGAGLVRIATRDDHAAQLTAARPELMVSGVGSADGLEKLMGQSAVVALGPGLGTGPWSRGLFESALGFEGPLVIDADGLNLLAGSPDQRDDRVLTPHPGEAARLLGASTREVQSDRFAAAAEIARKYGGVCLLKGAGSVLARHSPAPQFAVCATGNPGMATAGMGDVLTGVVAALMAQGLPPWEAACAAAVAHGRAGDLAAADGERGLLAGDVIDHLRLCVNP